MDTNSFSNNPSALGRYIIRVRGHLNDPLGDWLGGLTIENLENGEAVLEGQVTDQAALFGVLERLHRRGIPVLLCWTKKSSVVNYCALVPSRRSLKVMV